MTYIEFYFEFRQVILEHAHDLAPSCLSARDFDAFSSSGSHIYHFFEFWMFQRRDRLVRLSLVSDFVRYNHNVSNIPDQSRSAIQ
jgi:hypothetical protein